MSRDRPDAPPGSPLDKVYNALLAKGSTWGGGQDWTCPVEEHDDHRPSLGVGPGDKQAVVIKCGRCDTEDVVDALGLTMDDLKAPKPKPTRRRKVASWTYTDEDRKKLYRVDRYEPKDFAQVAYNDDGSERKGRGALTGVRRVLLDLRAVLDHCADGGHIVICEGEKAARDQRQKHQAKARHRTTVGDDGSRRREGGVAARVHRRPRRGRARHDHRGPRRRGTGARG